MRLRCHGTNKDDSWPSCARHVAGDLAPLEVIHRTAQHLVALFAQSKFGAAPVDVCAGSQPVRFGDARLMREHGYHTANLNLGGGKVPAPA